jgi:acyl-CoA thioesterase-1
MTSQGITLVYMGDSVTVGQHIDPALRWTTLVDQRLRAEFGDAVGAQNSGVSGETTRMGLERFPHAVQEFRPDVMTLQFGLNDCNCWRTDEGLPRVSPAAFVANLNEMIERARRFGAAEIVLATNHRTLRRGPLPSGEPYEEANARYNELIRDVAAASGVTLCDVWQAFVPFDDRVLDRMLLPAPDALHLSEEGNRVYCNAIWPFVRESVSTVLTSKGALIER